jgi:ATP-binding cassette, subfamily B, bacterial
MIRAFPFYKQLDVFDCGPTCLQMVARFYGKKYSMAYLRDECFITKEGVSLLGISQAAEKIGLKTLMVKVSLEGLKNDCPLPAILHWNQDHFVVLYKIKRANRFSRQPAYRYIIADPGQGMMTLSEEVFLQCWQPAGSVQGIALLMEPTPDFYSKKTTLPTATNGYKTLLRYLRPYHKQLVWLFTFMVLSIAITVALPYLTTSLVDKGVIPHNPSAVVLLIFIQFVLYAGSSLLDVLRSWVLLNMNAKISLNIISDFLKKLLRLPIRFFDSKSVGDVSQRITDHHRIENFLTTDIITSIFSILQIIVFSVILFTYRLNIWITFTLCSLAGIGWIFLFQKKRQQMDYIRFNQSKTTQDKLFELVVGMQEIKLFGSENTKRWEWEHLQIKQYRLNIRSLKLEQLQQTGYYFLTYSKNIIISYMAAMSVIHQQFSLGVMLSISFIIGQTNGPLQQLIQFFKSAQDAKLSFNRFQEVHEKADEEKEEYPVQAEVAGEIHEAIRLENVSFQYQGPRSPFVLQDIDLVIPKGKVTAIVGASGSGKTTLMKLILGFYQPTAGNVLIGNHNLADFSPSWWRQQCGTVMQDGYIFNDSIKKNIVADGSDADPLRFEQAVEVSRADEFVNQLPLQYHTRIGTSGTGLSGGQKQRILIARAVYKDTNYLLLDEATSSLDANNESAIMDSLDNYFIGKTVVIIAHRLSTVRNADQIIVLEHGRIVETGDHFSLATKRGRYYELVKNQLELGA